MEDLDTKSISFKTEDGENHVGMINRSMVEDSVAILYHYRNRSGQSLPEEYKTTETTLRQKIASGDWVLIDLD